MTAYAYIFTRSRYVDYNVFARPTQDILPAIVAEDFYKKISGVLNIDDNEELQVPQYVYIRKSNVVLWGICVLSNYLVNNKDYSTDYVGQPTRCFTGIVIPEGTLAPYSLPMEVEFFAKLYGDIVVPLWEEHFLTSRPYEICLPTGEGRLSQRVGIDVNSDKDCLRVFFGKKYAEQVLSACIAYRDDISVATNVYSIRRASKPQFNPFTNIVLAEEKDTVYKDILVKHLCPNCKKEVPYSEIKDGYCDSCRPRIVTEETEESEVPMYECKKCHNVFKRLTEKGYCETCAKKEKYHKYVWMAAIMLCVLSLIKDCQTFHFNIPKINIPSLFKSNNNEEKSNTNQDLPNRKGYKYEDGTINVKGNHKSL